MEILEKTRPNDPYCDPLKEMEKLFGMAGAADTDVCYAADDDDDDWADDEDDNDDEPDDPDWIDVEDALYGEEDEEDDE